MKNLVKVLSRLAERNVKCIFAYDLKVGGYIDYSYFDSCDNIVSGTYLINNSVSLAILTSNF